MLKFREIYSFGNISELPLREPVDENMAHQQLASLDGHESQEPEDSQQEDRNDDTELILVDLAIELASLTNCLFNTLSTVEIAMKTVILNQIQNPALEEREMTLIKTESEMSLGELDSGPVKNLLSLDLELIAAMQESLRETKYAQYLADKSPNFNAKKFLEELSEQKSQIKYWTRRLEERGQSASKETDTAIVLNLARIARVFGMLDLQLAIHLIATSLATRLLFATPSLSMYFITLCTFKSLTFEAPLCKNTSRFSGTY